MKTIRALALLVALCVSFVLGAAKCLAESPERLLYSTRNIAPTTVAEKLGEVFKDAGVVIAAVPATSNVLISAPPSAMREIERLLGQLDKRPRQISITAWIVDLRPELKEGETGPSAPFFSTGSRKEFVEQLAKLEKEGRVAIVNQFQFTTADNQPVSAQQGERKPRITATNVTTTGRINTTTFENVGTLMKFHARVIANNELAMTATVEKSYIGPESKGIIIAEPNVGLVVRSPSYMTLTAQTTVNMKNGEVVNVAGLKSKPDSAADDFQVLIVAEILPEVEAK
jgi:type II secretory pathway component GspD/PulD (secretin)